jgi:hypothetical protein
MMRMGWWVHLIGWFGGPSTPSTHVTKARDRMDEIKAATIAFAIDCKVAFNIVPKSLMEADTA